MNKYKSDYQRFNLYIASVLTIVGLSYLLYITLVDPTMSTCSYKLLYGNECPSCGLSRDFVSFIKFDFDRPINSNSFAVFIFFMSQLCYRFITYILEWASKVTVCFVGIDIFLTMIWVASVLWL